MLTPRSTTVPINWHKLTQPILICVDGSGDYGGPDPTATYDTEKANSFVNQIHREGAGPAAQRNATIGGRTGRGSAGGWCIRIQWLRR